MIRAWQVKSDSPCGWVAVYPNMTTSLNNGHKSINAVFLQFSSVQGGQHKEAGPLSPRHETWPHNETQQVVRFAVLSASLCQLSSLLSCFCVRLSHELWSFHFSSLSLFLPGCPLVRSQIDNMFLGCVSYGPLVQLRVHLGHVFYLQDCMLLPKHNQRWMDSYQKCIPVQGQVSCCEDNPKLHGGVANASKIDFKLVSIL